MRRAHQLAVVTLLAAAVAGCGGGDDPEPAPAAAPDRVTLRLPAQPEARFGGYLAADAQGLYDDVGLDVTIVGGGRGRSAEDAVASGDAELGVGRLPDLLAARERGDDLVSVAQVFARSSLVRIAHGDGATSAAHAAAAQAAPARDTARFAGRKLDATTVTSYDGLARVLESENPETGRRYTLRDLELSALEETGTAMLEDGVFARGDWLARERNRDVVRRFLEASFRGWIACRDLPEDCLRNVLEHEPPRGESHQRWQLNEVNALIWPSDTAIGVMDQAAFARTARIARRLGVVRRPASRRSYRTDIAESALVALTDDVHAAGWTKRTVHLLPGGA